MKLLSKEEFAVLADFQGEPSLSLYIPTSQASRDTQQHPIRFEHAIVTAETMLGEQGYTAAQARELLLPARDLLHDRPFWEQAGDAAAAFVAPGFFRAYRLPYSIDEFVIVGARFHLMPVLPSLVDDGMFFVLALSRNHVRLLRGSRDSIEELALTDIPSSLEDTLKYDEFESQHQFHSGVPGRGGARGAIFHGHGGTDDYIKAEVLRYCQQIDHGLCRHLCGERAPLVLAGVKDLLAIYRMANTYPGLIAEIIPGNPERLSAAELHRRAWELVDPTFRQPQAAALARYQTLAASKPHRATGYLRSIIPAAAEGRIDTLFAATDRQCWGTFDPASGTLTIHTSSRTGDDDLLDLAAIQTIQHGGTVYALPSEQMPGGEICAAIFRY